MAYKYIIYEPGKVARIKMNRPEYRNALSHEMMEEMDDAFKQAEADDNVEVIVLSGEGKSFSGGHDLGTSEHLALVIEADAPAAGLRRLGDAQRIGLGLEQAGHPIGVCRENP